MLESEVARLGGRFGRRPGSVIESFLVTSSFSRIAGWSNSEPLESGDAC
jgi:hypothetical protein